MISSDSLELYWCGDAGKSLDLANFFTDNVSPEYISHSELQGARAVDADTWSPNITDLVADEIRDRVARTCGHVDVGANNDPVLVGVLGGEGRRVGLGLILSNAPVSYGVVEDVVVEQSMRDLGIGKVMLDWISAQAVALGCRRLFLESGVRNHHAHDFFEREGFEICSVVMMKPLRPPATAGDGDGHKKS